MEATLVQSSAMASRAVAMSFVARAPASAWAWTALLISRSSCDTCSAASSMRGSSDGKDRSFGNNTFRYATGSKSVASSGSSLGSTSAKFCCCWSDIEGSLRGGSVAGAAMVALLLMFCREVGFRHLTCLPVAHGCAAPRQAVGPAEVRITSLAACTVCVRCQLVICRALEIGSRLAKRLRAGRPRRLAYKIALAACKTLAISRRVLSVCVTRRRHSGFDADAVPPEAPPPSPTQPDAVAAAPWNTTS